MKEELKKQKISAKLAEYVNRLGSQVKAANSLKDVSNATISNMLSNKWDLITDEKWRNVAAQIGYTEEEWCAVQTRDFRTITQILTDAQENSLVFAITGEAGTGKSYTLRQYAQSNRNAYLVQSCEYWNRKTFLQELLTVMGRDSSGYTVTEMMGEIVRVLKTKESPILIFDEFDKVSDQILYFFITLYNQLEDRCGIVLCATDHLSKRIKKGLRINKKGYKEIFSRIGRKFIELQGAGLKDITMICMANGVESREAIKDIMEDAEGDLRRVKRKIHAYKKAA